MLSLSQTQVNQEIDDLKHNKINQIDDVVDLFEVLFGLLDLFRNYDDNR